MGFETILGLSLIKEDINIAKYHKTNCGKRYWQDFNTFDIHISEIGYIAGKVYEIGNNIFEKLCNESIYEYWYGNHYNDDEEDDNYGTAKY